MLLDLMIPCLSGFFPFSPPLLVPHRGYCGWDSGSPSCAQGWHQATEAVGGRETSAGTAGERGWCSSRAPGKGIQEPWWAFYTWCGNGLPMIHWQVVLDLQLIHLAFVWSDSGPPLGLLMTQIWSSNSSPLWLGIRPTFFIICSTLWSHDHNL